MYIVVVGCGNVGSHLTKALVAIGHEVLVIDKNPLRCQTLQEELGSVDVAILGDGTVLDVLRTAGVARAKVVIASASRDEDNLAVCQIAKHHFNTPKTMALVKQPENEALFKLLGVDVTINVTHPALATIEEEIPGHALVHLMNLKAPHTEMVSINIPSDASVAGKSLGDIVLPPNSFISLVVKSEGPKLPKDSIVIESGDDVVAVTSPEEEQLLYETLTGVK